MRTHSKRLSSSWFLVLALVIVTSATACITADPPVGPAPDQGSPEPKEDMAQVEDMKPEVLALELSGLDAAPLSGKAPVEVSFSVAASGGLEPYRASWEFGDGSPAGEGMETTHTYRRGGAFVARVTLTDASGQAVSESIRLAIDPPEEPIIADLKATPANGIAPLTVTFQPTITNTSNDVTYEWDFKDGQTSDRQSPTHVFDNSGTYDVTLVVTDEATGAKSATAVISVKVADDGAPVAAASATPQAGIVPLVTSFRGTVVGGNEPFAYSWNFGDGSAPMETQNPSHEYTTPGTYTALFTVTDADGDSDTASVEVRVQSNNVPQLEIMATPPVGLAPLSVQFSPGVQGGDQPLSFAWSFGDGDSATQANPSHVYDTPGAYDVTLKVTDANGDEATDTAQIVVNDDNTPTVTASATPTNGLAPLQVQLSANGMGGNGALSYSWSFGDGNSATGKSTSYTYQSAGLFTATVTVTDEDGDVATDSVMIDVGSDLVPTASASAATTSGFAPLTVNFFGSAQGGNGAITYQWTFGDGSMASTDQNPSHVYTVSGTYAAVVVVTDADGDSSSAQVDVTVLDNAVPAVNASASPDTGITPFNVDFQATVSQGDAPFSYRWDFGDGSMSSAVQNPSHSYTTAGTFTATVTVTDANGDTASDTVTITAADNTQPIVTAAADRDTGTVPLAISFSATGSGGNAPLSYQWFFGDGSAPSGQKDTSHTYLNPGIYTATVVVTDADGDTSQDTITINALEQAPDLRVESFTAIPSGRDVDYTVVIRNDGVEDATSSFVVRFYNDLAAAPDSATTATTTRFITTPIAAGMSATVTATAFNRPIGQYTAWVNVDPLRENPDLDRANNIGGPAQVDITGLAINEIYYTTPGPDTGTFVELFGLPGFDLSGYVLKRIDGTSGGATRFTLPMGTVIPADGLLVVGDGSVMNQDVDAGSWADLENGPDSLVLEDTAGVVIDAVAYGEFSAAQTSAGEGTPTTSVSQGHSQGRDLESSDTDNNAADFYIWRVPTPGAPNAHVLTSEADSCASAYLLSDGQPGEFLIEEDLAGNTNTYTSLDVSQPGCSSSKATLGGADQIFSFVVPPGSTANVTLDLDDNADVDIDAVLTGDPCASLDMGIIGCNAILTNTYTGLGPGTYYLVVFEDSDTLEVGASEPYRYEITIEYP